MKSIVWQLLKLADGTRSQQFAGVPSQVRAQLDLLVPAESRDLFAVLVLVDGHSDSEFEFSRCPVLSVSKFLDLEVLKS